METKPKKELIKWEPTLEEYYKFKMDEAKVWTGYYRKKLDEIQKNGETE